MLVYLERAMKAHPSAYQPRLILARLHLSKGRSDKVAVLLSGLEGGGVKTLKCCMLLGSLSWLKKIITLLRLHLKSWYSSSLMRLQGIISWPELMRLWVGMSLWRRACINQLILRLTILSPA